MLKENWKGSNFEIIEHKNHINDAINNGFDNINLKFIIKTHKTTMENGSVYNG